MNQDDPVFEGVTVPNAFKSLYLKCSKCNSEVGSSRMWNHPWRCSCGQLLLRPAREEILRKINGDERRAEEFRYMLKDLGWIYESGQFTGFAEVAFCAPELCLKTYRKGNPMKLTEKFGTIDQIERDHCSNPRLEPTEWKIHLIETGKVSEDKKKQWDGEIKVFNRMRNRRPRLSWMYEDILRYERDIPRLKNPFKKLIWNIKLFLLRRAFDKYQDVTSGERHYKVFNRFLRHH